MANDSFDMTDPVFFFVEEFFKRQYPLHCTKTNESFAVASIFKFLWHFFRNNDEVHTNEMETSEFDADEVQQICRSCLCKGDKLIPLDVPYNDVVNTKYEYVDECETIAKLMMACGNIQVN